jgi:predicted peptidase
MIKKINEVLKGLSKFERALIYLYVIGIASYSYFLWLESAGQTGGIFSNTRNAGNAMILSFIGAFSFFVLIPVFGYKAIINLKSKMLVSSVYIVLTLSMILELIIFKSL